MYILFSLYKSQVTLVAWVYFWVLYFPDPNMTIISVPVLCRFVTMAIFWS